MSSSFNTTATPGFDNLLLQSLMGRLQIRPQTTHNHNPSTHFLNQTLEDLLFDASSNLSDTDSDSDSKTQLAKEESKLEKEIIRTILTGKMDTLKPNSGQAVTINEHHICVGFHLDDGSDYRVWEWHGHIMLFDDEDGYMPEYIYGNYFERLQNKGANNGFVNGDEKVEEKEVEEVEEEEEKVGSLGLRELIGENDMGSSRVLHRHLNAGSSRFVQLNTQISMLFDVSV